MSDVIARVKIRFKKVGSLEGCGDSTNDSRTISYCLPVISSAVITDMLCLLGILDLNKSNSSYVMNFIYVLINMRAIFSFTPMSIMRKQTDTIGCR